MESSSCVRDKTVRPEKAGHMSVSNVIQPRLGRFNRNQVLRLIHPLFVMAVPKRSPVQKGSVSCRLTLRPALTVPSYSINSPDSYNDDARGSKNLDPPRIPVS